MTRSLQTRNQHLLWRAGFGPSVTQWDSLAEMPVKRMLKKLEAESQGAFIPFNIATGNEEAYGMMDAMARREAQKRSREQIRDLNLAWIERMVSGEQMLREKMSLFWHGHFAARNQSAVFVQQLINTIREHALGNFGTLLRAVSKSAAMLAFLNNQQNRKQRPNENFAREVMELFTLGRGQYTETDVKEAARAFTGWQFDRDGSFRFRANFHDEGEKTVLGSKGKLTGDDVIDIILKKRETAAFITRKIWRYFVGEPINETFVLKLSNRFYDSGYDLSALMHDIFSSDIFYEDKYIGARIKSPVELMVGIRRILPMKMGNPEIQLQMQRVLGQVLFYPPNVAGWPGGTDWIDGASLMYRMQIPRMTAMREMSAIRAKDDDDQEMGMGSKYDRRGMRRLDINIDWNTLLTPMEKIKREALLTETARLLWQTPMTIDPATVEKHLDGSSRDAYIKSAFIRLMGSPEYQIC
jgi:uncharacterized protein (DUF1800 family)